MPEVRESFSHLIYWMVRKARFVSLVGMINVIVFIIKSKRVGCIT